MLIAAVCRNIFLHSSGTQKEAFELSCNFALLVDSVQSPALNSHITH